MLLDLWYRVDLDQLVLLGTRLLVQRYRLASWLVSIDGVHDYLLVLSHPFRGLVNTGHCLAHLQQLLDPLVCNVTALGLALSVRPAALYVPERSHVSQKVKL